MAPSVSLYRLSPAARRVGTLPASLQMGATLSAGDSAQMGAGMICPLPDQQSAAHPPAMTTKEATTGPVMAVSGQRDEAG